MCNFQASKQILYSFTCLNWAHASFGPVLVQTHSITRSDWVVDGLRAMGRLGPKIMLRSKITRQASRKILSKKKLAGKTLPKAS